MKTKRAVVTKPKLHTLRMTDAELLRHERATKMLDFVERETKKREAAGPITRFLDSLSTDDAILLGLAAGYLIGAVVVMRTMD